MFLFYFGLLSMLTPPVAVASMVAASMAGSDMWRTGLVGVKLAAAAYLLPFLWVYNPALLLNGTPLAVVLVIFTATVAAWMLARALQGFGAISILSMLWCSALVIGALFIGSSTVWFGQESIWAAAVSMGGLALLLVLRYSERAKAVERRLALGT